MNFILDELPMNQGWALYSWCLENDGWLQFGGMKREGKGYIGQGTEPLIRQAKEAFKL